MSEPTAIIALTQSGLETAQRIRAGLTEGQIHGYGPRVTGADVEFADVGAHLRQLFGRGTNIIGVCAIGILVRVLASVVVEKCAEPPVIAVAEDGSAVVPVLGGHRGANELSVRIAAVFGTRAAITTSSETRWQIALDDPPRGWVLGDRTHYKEFVASLLAGTSCRLDAETDWLQSCGLVFDVNGELCITVADEPIAPDARTLVYHRQCYTLGVGCERNTSPEELIELVNRTLQQANLSAHCLAGVFSVDVKADELAVHAVGEALKIPVRFFDPATLEALTPRLATPSEIVFKEIGCHGVAEAAALAAAGADSELVVAKQKSKRATCALARAARLIETESLGSRRGRLAVVGLGPGKSQWRTPAADQAISEAAHLVGYSAYLQMLPAPSPTQTQHAYSLGEETERVDQALTLAGEGHRVALICSGDPGVYAMASLVFERLEQSSTPAWHRSEIVVLPGISAMHAASAIAGAPLGHDFCAISLSDLLTPWEVIENRLQAAARGNFVVALYNPASQRRRRGLDRALEILRAHRPVTTPVIVARQVGRDSQSVTVSRLSELDRESVDMNTLLIVGSTETRQFSSGRQGYVYTPRGYRLKPASGRYA